MIFNVKYMPYYIFSLVVLTFLGFVSNKAIQQLENGHENDEYRMVKEYLLNDSPLYGYNKPKLWIHTKYELNARKWKDFYSRNSTDLNQPYIHLTIKSIINHCGDDFHICLIDDQTFSKLLPSWEVDISTLPEPIKSHYRELALVELLYYYGGMVVPNTFLCRRNLKSLYEEETDGGLRPFVGENVNRTTDLLKGNGRKLPFLPDPFFMGGVKNDPVLLEFVDYLKRRNQTSVHFHNEFEFKGDTAYWCLEKKERGRLGVVSGELLGTKTYTTHKPILLEDLMEENYLELYPQNYGIYIPQDEILLRPKFKWFAVLSTEELLESNIIISKYLKESMVEGGAGKSGVKEYMNVKKSVVAL